MAAPANTAPPRPPPVPADARWDHAQTGFEWTSGGVDTEGRRHGRYRSWTRDGVLHGECDYDHGHVHGKNLTYHPDGTIASEADWVHGVIMDSVFRRSANPTPEPFAQAAPGVWSVRYCTRDGKTNYTIRYFAQDEAECGPDGNPLPPRPELVGADARWFAEIDRWVEGEIERGTNAQVGQWRWWSASGVLRHEELRDGKGEATIVVQYAPTGVLEKRITRDASGEQRDYFSADGWLSTRFRTDPRGREVYRGTWLPDGGLDNEAVREFDGDALATVAERGVGGVRTFEAKREGGAMACVLFASDGETPAASGLCADGKLTGAWRIYDGAGGVRRELDTTPLAIEHGPTGESLAWRLGEAMFRIDAPTHATPRELAGLADAGWAADPELPARISALIAADPLVREFAHAALETSLEDPVLAARALPFLARLLAHAAIDRPRLLAAIFEICAHAKASDVVAAALAAAWPAIFSAFGRATFEERQQIFALAQLAPVANADLLALARKDPDPAVRAFALDRLTELPGFAVADAQPSLGDKDALVRAAAAIAVGQRQGKAASRDVVRVLDESLRTWRDLARRFGELPYVERHVLVAIADAVAAIGTPDARSLARELCAHLDELEPADALAYGHAMLGLALGTGERPFAKRFLEILETIAKSKPFWILEHDAAALLRTYHLPASRLALTALVGELRAMPDPEGALLAKLRR